MTQLYIEYDGDFEFTLKCEGNTVGCLSYELHDEDEDEFAHLKKLKSIFEQFKIEFEDGKQDISFCWSNGSHAGISLKYNVNYNKIKLSIDSYEQAGAELSVPIIEKSEVLDNIDNIIESIEESINALKHFAQM